MNKKEYLAKLRMYLQGLPISELEDIISDYEEHFNIGISKGKSEEEISKELGDPKEVALGYINSLDSNLEENRQERRNNRKWITIVAGIVLVVFAISFLSYHSSYNPGFSPGIFSLKSDGDMVRIGPKGIEVKDGEDHVVIGWNGIKVKGGADEVSIGWDGIKVKDGNRSAFKSNGWSFLGLSNKDLKWEEVDEEKFADLDEVKNISISSPFIDVKVTSQDRDDLRIHYHGRMRTNVVPELVVDKVNGDLEIKLQLSQNSYSVIESKAVLEVFIPNSFKGNINSMASSGDIYMKNIVGDNLNFSTSSGDLFLENLKGKVINITTSSGDMNLNQLIGDIISINTSSGNMKTSNLVGKLTAKTSSGDISLKDISSEEIKLSTSSGDIVINLDDSANYKIKGSTSSGDFIPNKKMVVEENRRGRFMATVGEGLYPMEIQTSSGDVIFK